MMKWPWVDELKADGAAYRWPIRLGILILLALVLVALWMAVIRQVEQERSHARDTAITLTQNRSVALEQYVARTLESADLVTRYLGHKFLMSPNRTQGGVLFIGDPTVDRQLFASAHVFGPNGDLVATTVAPADLARLAKPPVLEQPLSGDPDGLKISRPLPMPPLRGLYVHASRRISDESGRTLGYVSLQISPGQLLNFPRRVALRPTDVVSVIHLDGISLARREGDRISSGEDLRGRVVMQMQAANPNGTYLGPSSVDGQVRYFSHRRLNEFPVFATAGVSYESALEQAEARARYYYGLLLLFTLSCVAFVSFLLYAVDARQRRTSAIAEAYRRLAEAQRVAKIGDWEYDIASGRILWSDQLCRMYGRSLDSDHLTIDDFRSYLDEGQEQIFEEAIAAALRTKEAQSYEIRVRLPDGRTSDRHVIAVPVVDASGRVTAFYGTDQDVTDEKLLHVLQAQVAHLARLDSMNMMASTLAHELNQPLTAAANYLSGTRRLIADGGGSDVAQSLSGIDLATKQVHSAAEIIRRVRAMVKRQDTLREATSLQSALEGAISLLVTTGGCQKGTIRTNLAPDAAVVWADAVQLQQVLTNLLRNACEAAPSDKPVIAVTSFPLESGYVRVEISDNGPGFSKPVEVAMASFDSEKPEGLGLGLSISRTIVEYYGGRIRVERSGASGTIVAFELPSRRPQD